MTMTTTLGLETDLLDSINSCKSGLSLNYQPIFSISSKSAVRWEALIRWKHPAYGMIPPEQVVTLAHRVKADATLVRWVLNTVGIALAEARHNTKISVNIPGFMLLKPKVVLKEIESMLSLYCVKSSLLEIELTERYPLLQNKKTFGALRLLQQIGVTVALDDFGCGHSGLAALRDFQFDRIKLDKSFFYADRQGLRNDLIVKNVVCLAQALDIPVTAEGIETDRQLQFAEVNQFTELQGYFLGRPKEKISSHLDI